MSDTAPQTAKVKNITSDALIVGWLDGRLVLAGQAIEVPAEDVYAYTQQADTWEPYDNAAKKAHKDAMLSREATQTAAAADFAARFGGDMPDQDPSPNPDTTTPAPAAQTGTTPRED